tara:strand:+ start:325 stop:603 length:279 start_codon:yes stop_codon:yes gene_type:complete
MKNYLIGLFLILSMVIVYLFFFSQNSIFTQIKLKKKIAENKEILNSLQKERKELQDNVKKLKSNDTEFLDNLARDKYDMSDPDEVIIFNNKE